MGVGYALLIFEGMDKPIVRPKIALERLNTEIQAHQFASDEKALEGRILIIEDLTRDLIEFLGVKLDIDPLFFSLHLHTVHRTSSRHPSAILDAGKTGVL